MLDEFGGEVVWLTSGSRRSRKWFSGSLPMTTDLTGKGTLLKAMFLHVTLQSADY